jgi:hypothetical protein
LRRIALAIGAIEKAGAAVYEQPSPYRRPDWIERCRTQAAGAIEALAAEPWPKDERLDQAQITAACMIRTCGWPIPTARALSGARHAVRELRGATRIPSDLSRRICRAGKRMSADRRQSRPRMGSFSVISAVFPSSRRLLGGS